MIVLHLQSRLFAFKDFQAFDEFCLAINIFKECVKDKNERLAHIFHSDVGVEIGVSAGRIGNEAGKN